MYRISARASLRLGAMITAALVLGSCAMTTEQIPDEEIAELVGSSLSSSTNGDLAVLGTISESGVVMASVADPRSTSVTVERTVTRAAGDLALNLTVTFYNGGFTASDEVGTAAEADRFTVEGTVTGSGERTRYDSSINSTIDWEIVDSDGVLFDGQGTYTINGTSTQESSVEFTSFNATRSRSFTGNLSRSWNDVQVIITTENDVATAEPSGRSIAVSGSYTRSGDGTFRSGSGSWSGDATVEFGTDGTATVTVDGQRSYTVDLANGTTVSVDS